MHLTARGDSALLSAPPVVGRSGSGVPWTTTIVLAAERDRPARCIYIAPIRHGAAEYFMWRGKPPVCIDA